MRRADRLFELIQELRMARGPVTAAQLAEQLEVTPRTIYRDVASLQGMRVPIDGEAGVGYVMRRGYDLPPLMFSAEEVEAIIKVGADSYVPPDVDLRARIDERMFTATCTFATIARLEDDPDIVSVAVSRPLRVIGEQKAEARTAIAEESESDLAAEAKSEAEPEVETRQDE